MRKIENIGRLKVFLKDPKKKNVFRIIKEVIILTIRKKEIPFYYFKYLYRKSVNNYLDYLSTKEVNKIGHSKLLHNPSFKSLIDNKLFFSLFCEKTQIKTPRLISYNLGSSFFYNGRTTEHKSLEEIKSFFESVFHESNCQELFFRPLAESGGKGCFKLTKNNLANELSEKHNLFSQTSYVHTEVVQQHPDMNKIHDKSLSTMRIITLVTNKNTFEIIGAFMRFGVGNSVVDNSSSGGFYVGIDMDHGTLKEIGHYMPEYGGGETTEHPDSKFKFGGYKVPFFEQACEDLKKAITYIPDRFIGWDVAISTNGPIIIEANKGPHLPSADIGYGGLLKNPHMKNLLEELN